MAGIASCLVRCLATIALTTLALAAGAEKGDRDKPINIEADKVTLDDKQKVGVFEGNVVLTQGTLRITAAKITVREDKTGNQSATAIGKPTTFRQKRDAVDEYIEGAAERIEYDGKTERVELFTSASLRRNQDEVRGNYISYDAPTEFYQVLGGGTATASATPSTSGRVMMKIQPKPRAQSAAPTAQSKPSEPSAGPRE